MSTRAATYARIVRRETHSPRSVLAIGVAIIAIVVFAWLGTEVILALVGRPPLLVAPAGLFTSAVGAVGAPAGTVAAVGIAVAVIGLALILAAVLPGRRARHVLDTQRAATVVDNEVIASALARQASQAGNVDPDSVIVSVSHRRAVVHLTPTSGMPVDRERIAAAVTEQIASYGLRGTLRPRVEIAKQAKVGA